MHKLLAESKRILSRETDARSSLFERSQRTLREMDDDLPERMSKTEVEDAVSSIGTTLVYELAEWYVEAAGQIAEEAGADYLHPVDEMYAKHLLFKKAAKFAYEEYKEAAQEFGVNEMEMDYGTKKKRMKPQYEMKSKGYGRRGKYEMDYDKKSGKYKSEMKDKGYGSKK